MGSHIITYAASAENSSPDLVNEVSSIPGKLDHIKTLSVRDTHTKDLVQPIANVQVEIVCDPTLLLSADDYVFFQKDIQLAGNYILLYIFERLSDKAIENLTAFAGHMKLKIVSLTRSAPFADEKIPRSPWNFISYFKHADYIITDTFHGNIFSIIFKKQFVSVKRGLNKVSDLLERLHLSHRLVEDGEGLISVLEQPIEWDKPDNALSDLREQSLEYLHSALDFYE